MAIALRRVRKGGSEIEPAKHRGATELNDSDEFRAARSRISAHMKMQRRERTTMAPEPHKVTNLSKSRSPLIAFLLREESCQSAALDNESF
jgi:hypothetical protein